MKRHILIIISCLMALSLSGTLFAQTPAGLTGQTKNYISTGMPILLIAPDATSAGMGDVGVASTPDIYSAHWNNAKFAFIDGNFGIGTTYTPWLRNLKVSDMNLLYLGAFKRINNRSTVAFSLTYFSLGEIQGTEGRHQQPEMSVRRSLELECRHHTGYHRHPHQDEEAEPSVEFFFLYHRSSVNVR